MPPPTSHERTPRYHINHMTLYMYNLVDFTQDHLLKIHMRPVLLVTPMFGLYTLFQDTRAQQRMTTDEHYCPPLDTSFFDDLMIGHPIDPTYCHDTYIGAGFLHI